MLEHIQIRNFAIIDELDLELSGGLTVITGETGAGKSIMVDAIALVLGARAKSGIVRHGQKKADISLVLNPHSKEIRSWLEQHDLDDDGQCLLRRVITSEGKSRCYINGNSVTLAMMGDLSQQLVEISGQNTHQNLLSPNYQRQILDNHADLQANMVKLRKYWEEWRDYSHTLEELQSNSSERQLRLDLVQFQLEELQELALLPGEIESLHISQNKLAHVDQLITTTSEVQSILYESDNAIHQQLTNTAQQLQDIHHLEPRLDNPKNLLNEAMIQIQEAADELRNIRDGIDADPESLNQVEQRLDLAHSLARKHRIEPEQLPEKLQELEDEHHLLSDPLQNSESLREAKLIAEKRYDKLAHTISKKRKKVAHELSTEITKVIQSIGLEGGQIEIVLTANNNQERKASGLESASIQASMNPGQPLAALSKVASGGELSRLSLAIQLITAEKMQYPTLIFDEVDTGIGGATAEIVGKLLQNLSIHCQVFCITHLPQIAAKGLHHLKVDKRKTSTQTQTTLIPLDKQQRIEEIARMLGGEKLTKESIAHAKEMLQT